MIVQWRDTSYMNTATLTIQKARALASSLITSRHHGYGASMAQDRDLARETHELYLISQGTRPRTF